MTGGDVDVLLQSVTCHSGMDCAIMTGGDVDVLLLSVVRHLGLDCHYDRRGC